MTQFRKLLLVEDNPDDVNLIREVLYPDTDIEFEIISVDRLASAVTLLENQAVDVVLLDLGLPDSSGVQTVKTLHDLFPELPIVVITGNGNGELGMESVKNGAQDYLVKGLTPAPRYQMVQVLQYAIQRNEAEKKIRKSAKLLRCSIDGLSANIAIVDDKANILVVNRAWELFAEKNGVPADTNWKNVNYLAVCDRSAEGGDTTALEFASGIRKVISRQTPSFEMDYPCHAPGELRWFHGKVTPFGDDELPYVILTHENITQREASRRELLYSRETFKKIINNVSIGIALINPDFEIIEMNLQMEKWATNAFKDKNNKCQEIIDCMCKGRPDMKTCPVCRTFSQGGPYSTLERTPKGIFRLTASPLPDEKGEVASVILLKEDVTEQLSVERRLRQAQKMESLGTLAGGVAHDFNNILTAILGFASLIKQERSDDVRLNEDLQEIENAGLRASGLVNQILTFCRMKETRFEPLRIDIILSEAMKLLRSTMPATIEIRIAIEKRPEFVLADPTQIHQIIMNLCTNAGHAMEEKGGILEVRLEKKTLTYERDPKYFDLQPGDFLVLRVKDTGYGISPEIMELIFDPYFTTKNLGEGTGLGLSMVQGIVKAYGGEIIVESEPGKGSVFNIFFPIIVSAVENDNIDDDNLLKGHNELILLIDDEPAILKFENRILESLEYNVVTESSSEAALDRFKKDPHAFDLVITDMTMPKMNGMVLSQKLLEVRGDIPIIICTGFSKHLSQERCKQIGIRAILSKPLSIPVLASEIRKILD